MVSWSGVPKGGQSRQGNVLVHVSRPSAWWRKMRGKDNSRGSAASDLASSPGSRNPRLKDQLAQLGQALDGQTGVRVSWFTGVKSARPGRGLAIGHLARPKDSNGIIPRIEDPRRHRRERYCLLSRRPRCSHPFLSRSTVLSPVLSSLASSRHD